MKQIYYKVTWMTNGKIYRRYFPTVEAAQKKQMELTGSRREHHIVRVWEVERYEYGADMVERVIDIVK